MAPTNSPTGASLFSSYDLTGLLTSLGSACLDENLDDVGSILAEKIDVVPFFLGEPLQHERGGIHPAGRTANSTFESPEGFVAERADDRSNAVVAARPTPILDAQLGEGQIDVVVHNEQPIQGDSEVADQWGDRLARLVHERERSRQYGAVPVEIDLGLLGADSRRLLETRLMAFGKRGNHVCAEVVPRVLVTLARVAQPDNECR